MIDEEYFWRHTVPTDKLRAMLEQERKRALAGSWAYDLARHAAMLRVYNEKKAAEDATQARPDRAEEAGSGA